MTRSEPYRELPNLQAVAESVSDNAGRLHGSIRVWGEWIGRAMDIDLHLAMARVDGTCLVLEFVEGTTVRIDPPEHVAMALQRSSLDTAVLEVEGAQRVTVQQLTGNRGSAQATSVFESVTAAHGTTAFALF